MLLRRDTPEGQLWRTALRAQVAILETSLQPDDATSAFPPDSPGETANESPPKARLWRELADLFEKFLLGTCGRAVAQPSSSLPTPESLTADEELENLLLNCLCSKVLSRCLTSPPEVSPIYSPHFFFSPTFCFHSVFFPTLPFFDFTTALHLP